MPCSPQRRQVAEQALRVHRSTSQSAPSPAPAQTRQPESVRVDGAKRQSLQMIAGGLLQSPQR